MEACKPADGRRGFLKKSTAIVALYLSPSLLTKAFAYDKLVPSPVEKEKLPLIINGKQYELMVDVRMSLLDLLREQIGLTGSKKGCDMGQCGACIVLVNGKRVNGCMTLAVDNANNKITTIEGLATPEKLHPVQEAFITHDAMQCGYCTPGQIMSAVACIREGHANTREEIKTYMEGNICRCGAYQNIVDAILDVKKSGKPV
jgi:xanthine dehydrogenase YagT iron-sulfur-binding subunit